jgi:acylphosphatase
MTVRVRLRIHGQVQGVSFRYYARQRASVLGLSGWVRNRADGTVEAEAQGAEDAVDQFVAWAGDGPSLAEVRRVEMDQIPLQEDVSFRITH